MKSTKQQRKADVSAIIAGICFLLMGFLLLLAAANQPQPEPELEPEAVEQPVTVAVIETPATEYAYYDGKLVYYEITSDDRATLECIVQGEAGGESLEGKMWVATCLLNAMRKDGLTAEEARTAYQYAGWSEDVSDETISAVSRVFDDGDTTHDTVLWFYAPKFCNGAWHETQSYVATIGNHKFFAPEVAENE